MPGRAPAGREWQRWLWPGRGYCSTDVPSTTCAFSHRICKTPQIRTTRILEPKLSPPFSSSTSFRAPFYYVAGVYNLRSPLRLPPALAAWHPHLPLHSVLTQRTPAKKTPKSCAVFSLKVASLRREAKRAMLHV